MIAQLVVSDDTILLICHVYDEAPLGAYFVFVVSSVLSHEVQAVFLSPATWDMVAEAHKSTRVTVIQLDFVQDADVDPNLHQSLIDFDENAATLVSKLISP